MEATEFTVALVKFECLNLHGGTTARALNHSISRRISRRLILNKEYHFSSRGCRLTATRIQTNTKISAWTWTLTMRRFEISHSSTTISRLVVFILTGLCLKRHDLLAAVCGPFRHYLFRYDPIKNQRGAFAKSTNKAPAEATPDSYALSAKIRIGGAPMITAEMSRLGLRQNFQEMVTRIINFQLMPSLSTEMRQLSHSRLKKTTEAKS